MSVTAKPILPTEKRKALQKDPGILTLYGQSKVGKTYMLTQLKDCLIIDTEGGTKTYDALTVEATNLNQLIEYLKELKKPENKGMYKYIAIDTIDNVADWYEKYVAQTYGVRSIGDVPYGAGYGLHREKIMTFMKTLRTVCPRVILIGHRKRAIIGDTSIEVQVTSLDLMGKLKNLVSAESDAVGYAFRKDKDLWISFETSNELEVGSRCDHLSGKSFPFEWKTIYKDKLN